MDQLRAIVVLADVGNFTRAAAQLHTSQPSLSRAIAEAERKLGVKMFDRTTRNVQVTAAGASILQVSREIVATYDAGLARISSIGTTGQSVVTIAALPSLAAVVLPGFMSWARTHVPAIDFRVKVGPGAMVHALVESGAADVGVGVATDMPDALQFQPMAKDEFLFVAAPSHPLCQESVVTWRQLCAETLVTYTNRTSVTPLIEQSLTSCGRRPVAEVECDDLGAAAGLIAAGIGVSAVPRFVYPVMKFAGLASRPLIDPTTSRELGLIELKKTREFPGGELFRQQLRKQFSKVRSRRDSAAQAVRAPG